MTAETTTPPQPDIPQKGPYKIELMATYRYAWCACGLSKYQPFCDGSHTSKPGLFPVIWTQEKDATVYLCGCKHSAKPPFCDASHKKL
jgi:CDGSH-type Zn-finger protein